MVTIDYKILVANLVSIRDRNLGVESQVKESVGSEHEYLSRCKHRQSRIAPPFNLALLFIVEQLSGKADDHCC